MQHADEFEKLVGISVEITEEPPFICVVLKNVGLPPGVFKLENSDLLFLADYQYPDSPLDMFWTDLEVIRPSGAIPQAAENIEQHVHGKSWRRFSWHRNGIWNPTHNGILDHYELTMARIEHERTVPA